LIGPEAEQLAVVTTPKALAPALKQQVLTELHVPLKLWHPMS
jgi:hypothetical protein